MKIAEFGPLVVYCVCYTVENYSLSPTFSCKSGGCPPFLALTASPQRREVHIREHVHAQFQCAFLEITGSQGLQRFRLQHVIGTGYEGGVCVIVLLTFRAFAWYRLRNFEILRRVVPLPRAGHIL